MEVKKKEGEAVGSLIYRFNKKVQHSGILKEAKKRRFRERPVNRIKRRQSALHRDRRAREVVRLKKLGKI